LKPFIYIYVLIYIDLFYLFLLFNLFQYILIYLFTYIILSIDLIHLFLAFNLSLIMVCFIYHYYYLIYIKSHTNFLLLLFNLFSVNNSYIYL